MSEVRTTDTIRIHRLKVRQETSHLRVNQIASWKLSYSNRENCKFCEFEQYWPLYQSVHLMGQTLYNMGMKLEITKGMWFCSILHKKLRLTVVVITEAIIQIAPKWTQQKYAMSGMDWDIMSELIVWQANLISERGPIGTQLTNPSEPDPVVVLGLWTHGYFRIPTARRNSGFGDQMWNFWDYLFKTDEITR